MKMIKGLPPKTRDVDYLVYLSSGEYAVVWYDGYDFIPSGAGTDYDMADVTLNGDILSYSKLEIKG